MDTYCQYFNVFGEKANRDLFCLALSKREHFTHSKTSPSKLYPDWRRSTVIYDDQLVGVAGRLEREIRVRLPEVMAALQIPAFDIGSFEIQLTSHNDGEYYRWHTDNGTPNTESRVVTFVYYFHNLPRRFSGGELLIHESKERQVVVDPENDSIVFFNSRTKHEVKAVACPSGRFEDGRFTLNGWIRRKTPARRDSYFDSRIFSPPNRTGVRDAVSRLTTEDARGLLASNLVGMPQPRPDERMLPRSGDAPESQGRSEAHVSLLNLYANLYRQSRRAGTIDVLRRISKAEFYENYYFANRPVILKDLASTSAAVRTWSPMFFKKNYGSVPVQITANRNCNPDYETSFRQSLQTITMAAFVERLCRDGETNDFYLVARNSFFENPALTTLKNDLQPPAEIINTADQSPGTVKLWFGPKGTVTPLHYDGHSILFMQVHGRKRFKLIPSFDLPMLYARKTFYSAVNPENVDTERYPLFHQASLSEVEVEPGDILFIPAGWWHWAKSLDVSISATFCSFHVEGRNTSLKVAEI